MSERLEGTFEVTSWSEEAVPDLESAAKVTQATIGQRFVGGVEAETIADLVMAYREDGTADYVGFQRVVGQVGDRRGSFVLQTIGTFDGQEAKAETAVVPGSGTGEFAGLGGTGTTVAPPGSSGTFALDLDFG